MKSLPISVALATVVLSGCAGLGTKSAGRDEAPDTHKQYWAKYDHSLKPVTPAVTLSEKLGLPEPARPAAGGTAAAATAAAAPVPAIRSCAEAAPDATLKLIARLEATQGKSQGGSAELDASVVRLAERTQMLSFLRESLYRTCERAAAGQISKEEAAAAYDKVMNSVHAIIETDRDRARESAAKAVKGLSPEQIKALQ
ncbi:hypothetical protein NMQ14_18565 [Methyloversatilis sp. XJ19-13]|uniref:hypothetical protein n=1 Tax=Methyloversatilis sp. XJ19-13 TaxID=2963430 RepID=UPI00211BC1B2|nr:hypothetical protein [Methyloversatilis sp. XJ19-13]MCQ9376253.1 hypothetical protein [Methyloversatilis sp. XJ19-13]